MTAWLIEMFGISLILTILAELAVTSFFGLGSGKKVLLVIMVNVLTNPPAVLFHWLGGMYLPNIPDLWMQSAIEIVVIIAEACVYRSFAGKQQWQFQRPVLMSAAANLCSWMMGMLLRSVL